MNYKDITFKILKSLKNLLSKNEIDDKKVDMKIKITNNQLKKSEKIEVSEEFMEDLKVIFAEHLVGRDNSNREYVISNIESTYIENPKLLYNKLIEEKKLIEMLPEDKLSVFTIKELNERFDFKKRLKKDIIQEIKDTYSIKEISQKTAGLRYKLSEEYTLKYNNLLEKYKKNNNEFYEIVIKNIINFNFLNILNKKLKKLATKDDLYNNIENKIPEISISETYYTKRLEEYNKINMKKYLNETDERLNNFRYFYFAQMVNPRNTEKYFEYFLNNEFVKINYEKYNQKYFDFKRNIEKQIFKQFIYFLNNKIGTQLSLKEYKENALLKYKEKIWNESCPVHKDNIPLKEEINEEIFCRCIVTYEAEYNF